MLRVSSVALAAAVFGSTALAGGIERSPQSVGVLFEEGRVVQLTFGYLSPSLSGTVAGGAVSSGDMAPSFTTTGIAYKMPIGEQLDFALIYDQSVGADVAYTNTDPAYPFAGVEANLDGADLTALIRYRLPSNVSIYGGLRLQSIEAVLTGLPIPSIPAIYTLNADRSYELGYVAGVAYERPEIALRVALTYNSAIDHKFDTTETFNGTAAGAPGFTTTIPQSVNLEFQSGIAADTLLFGSVRWQDWSEFDITPTALGAPLIDYQSDYTTYTLGVGRRFSENWSGAVTLGYEGQTGDVQGNLAPRDGFASIGVGATYTMGNTEITGGIRYLELGNATTQTIGANFSGNNAWAAGIRVLHRF